MSERQRESTNTGPEVIPKEKETGNLGLKRRDTCNWELRPQRESEMADGLSERGDKSVETVSSEKQEKGKKSEQSLGGPWGAVDRNSISTELRKEGRERAGKKKCC